ncbi:hypothetical protein [Microbacterium maritypicum]|uniref:hypothetical protein n=1 Tax=Microbacterium maritypicum TaxID=33918 RepID=UPI003D7075A6
MGLVKPPRADPSIDPFVDGLGVLSREGLPAGYVATTVGEFWSPSRPFRKQWWVWYVVIWPNGTREPSTEDYPPWSAVAEMRNGYLDVQGAGARDGRYDVSLLDADEAVAERMRLGVSTRDF